MKALEKDVFTKRGKPLKEAIPFDIELVSFSKCAWFKVGLELFDSEFPRVERDFWIPEMENKTFWRSSPPEYARSLQWLHHLVWLAGKEAGVSRAVLDQEDDEIDDQEDRDVTLTEFFVKAPDKGSSYDYKFSCLFKRLSGGDCLQASDHS
eukprot:s12670_g1.t1